MVTNNYTKDLPDNARIGFDVGGTNTKYVVLINNKVVHKDIRKTSEYVETIITDLVDTYRNLKTKYDIKTIGIGVAGNIKDGLVYTANLPFDAVPLEAKLKEKIDIPVFVDNDANCAALGELIFGSAKDCDNVFLLTLGTGIGGGVIINGQLCRGRGRIGEVGHMSVQMKGGLQCSCGHTGCWEQYASVSALIRQAEKAALDNPGSIIYELYVKNGQRLSGETIFEALQLRCPVAESVFDTYLSYLSVGIENINNIIDPDKIVITGAITKQGDSFLLPLKEKLSSDIRIEISSLQSDSGALGAAMLYKSKKEKGYGY